MSPNPSNGFVKINGLPKVKSINLNLFNSIGEKVFEKSVSNEDIDLTSLLDGFYICILVDSSTNVLLSKTKLIIKH
ncbi:MAG: T9SS type A sorting domain-containing protein [Bacteroidia bacterium]